MSLTRSLMSHGSYTVRLRPETPLRVRQLLRLTANAYASLVFTPAWLDSTAIDDATLLKFSLFTGIHRTRRDTLELRGPHATAWLSDEDGQGNLDETGASGTRTFSSWVLAIRPPALAAGTIHSVSGTMLWEYGWANDQNYDPKSALEAVCDHFTGAGVPVEYEVTNDLKLNAGKSTDLYASTNTVLLTEYGQGREHAAQLSVPCTFDVDEDASEYTTRVLVKDSAGNLGSYSPGSPSPFKDGRGNTLEQKRRLAGVEAEFGSLTAYAQGLYNRQPGIITNVTARTSHRCPLHTIRVGRNVAVWAPSRDVFIIFATAEYRGETLWPNFLRVVSITQPIAPGMGVYLRYYNSASLIVEDLTPWVEFETGESTIELGTLERKLSRSLAPHGSRSVI